MKMMKSDSIYLDETPPPEARKPAEPSTISWKDTHYQPPKTPVRENSMKAYQLPSRGLKC